jgi:hypothetical protein
MKPIMDEQLFDSIRGDLQVPALGPMLIRLATAVLLGAFIAYRPWRRFSGMVAPRREMVHAQILIALAGAIAVTVIGDSLARAFGLVGLGGFIRFRTGIRDPRDAAVFFLLIGLGMACGLGTLGLAAAATALVAVVVLALDLMAGNLEHPYIRVTAIADDPLGISGRTRAVIERFPVIIRNTNLKLETKELRFDLENPKGIDISVLQKALLEEANGDIVNLTCETLETLKGARA